MKSVHKRAMIIFLISATMGLLLFSISLNFKTIYIRGSIPLKAKADLIIDSAVIIKGTVKEILPSRWSNPDYEKGRNVRNILQTDIVVAVDELLKGNVDSNKLIVRIDQGETITTNVISEGYPNFTEKEEVILFLSKDDSDLANPNENYYVLTGMSQGKFELDNSIYGKKVFKSSFEESVESIELIGFDKEIQEVIEKEKLNPKKKLTKEEIKKGNEEVFGK